MPSVAPECWGYSAVVTIEGREAERFTITARLDISDEEGWTLYASMRWPIGTTSPEDFPHQQFKNLTVNEPPQSEALAAIQEMLAQRFECTVKHIILEGKWHTPYANR